MGTEGQPPTEDASQQADHPETPAITPPTEAPAQSTLSVIGPAPFTYEEPPLHFGALRPQHTPEIPVEPEWARWRPGFIPIPEEVPLDDGFADDDGLGSPGPTPEQLAAEAERRAEARRKRTRTVVRELVETGLLALLVFLAVRASFQNFQVEGNSMFPTLHDGQFLIVNKLLYSQVDVETASKFLPFIDAGDTTKRNVFHGPERGDIVVLVDPHKPDTDLIKRVVGLPGDSVEVVDGKVYINDYQLIEPYITIPWHGTEKKVTVPAEHYFVMGDNRDNSLDSRSPAVGMIPTDYIIGKAMLSYWPFDRFGIAPNEKSTISAENQRPKLSTELIPAAR